MAYIPDANDPFAPTRTTPSLSWRSLPVGSTFTLRVLEPAKLLQSKDFTTQKPKFWEDDPNRPVMSAVINVTVIAGPHSVGEERSVWAQRPSDLFNAIAQAQIDAGARITTGGLLHLRFNGETPHQDTRMNPIKNYLAKYEPPASTAHDVFAPAASAASPAPPAPPAPPGPPPGLQSWARPARATVPPPQVGTPATPDF
jgi:hypothetical protein